MSEASSVKRGADSQQRLVTPPSAIHILSLGGGVQSSTLALMAAAHEITPMPVAAIFADTQDEPAAVMEWLARLAVNLPFPTHKVTRGKPDG